ncbi:MAG: hypothetical protein PHE93_02865 [Clostridia bacterium]|nr:hypothetical protein [Clostridia bacterium]
MFIKKILILKSDNGKNSGVLRLTANGTEVEGVLTLNFAITSPLSLLLNTGETHEVSVLENECKFTLNSEFSGEAHCLLLENEMPLLSGSTNNDLRKLSELQNYYSEKKAKAIRNTEKTHNQDTIDNNSTETEREQNNDESKHASDSKYADNQLHDNYSKSANAKTGRNNHTASAKTASAQNSEPSAVINEGISYEGENFYIAVKPQLDEMFECYPTEERLQELISNSKWVRVDCDDEYYVVGLIFDENDKPEFICYGIPGTYPVKPPEEIADVCEWFPFDLENKFGDGFWLIYQNAMTGKCLKNA